MLTTCEVAPDGGAVRLNFEDVAGRPAAFTLPRICLQQLVMTLPVLLSKSLKAQHGDESLRLVFPLDNWRLEAAAGTKRLILTLTTPDGFEVTFSLEAQTISELMSAIEEHRSDSEQGRTLLNS
jgi:hypothetical protein